MSTWKATLIAELRTRELLRTEIAKIIGAGARGVERPIKRMGVLLQSRKDGRTKQVFYRLTDDVALVDAFLAEGEPKQTATRGAIERAKADTTRHVHILADDVTFVPKMHRGLPMADPMALPVEFFRAGQP